MITIIYNNGKPKDNFIMKKIMSILAKLFVWTIVGLFSAMFILAFIIGIVEGDLSHGLFYYLQ